MQRLRLPGPKITRRRGCFFPALTRTGHTLAFFASRAVTPVRQTLYPTADRPFGGVRNDLGSTAGDISRQFAGALRRRPAFPQPSRSLSRRAAGPMRAEARGGDVSSALFSRSPARMPHGSPVQSRSSGGAPNRTILLQPRGLWLTRANPTQADEQAEVRKLMPLAISSTNTSSLSRRPGFRRRLHLRGVVQTVQPVDEKSRGEIFGDRIWQTDQIDSPDDTGPAAESGAGSG